MRLIAAALLLAGCATASRSARHDQPLDDVLRAAAAGDADAIHDLCYRTKYGRKAAQDFAQALSWCTKGAQLGVDSSQVLLAELYLRGEGVTADETVGQHWFEAAAEQGHRHAQLMLYLMLRSREPQRAIVYLEQACADGYKPALAERDKLEAGVSKSMRAPAVGEL